MRLRLFSILLLFVLSMGYAIAQTHQTDSLLNLIHTTKKSSLKAEYLNSLGNLYRTKNLDSARIYISQAIKIAQKHKVHKELAKAYIEMGIICYSKNQKDSSKYYLNKGYEVARENKNYQGMLKSLNSTIIHETKSKNFERASEAIKEGLEYLNKVNDLRLTAMLYNNIAIFHKANGSIDRALEFYHRALSISEEQNDLKSVGLISSNMGLLYERQDKPDLALKYLNKSLAIRLKRKNKLGESYVRTNLGLVHENLKEYDKALEQYKKSLSLKKEIGSSKGIPILYNNMAIIFKKQNIYDSAHFYCNKALKLRIKYRDRLGEARTRTTLGQIHYLNNNLTDAERELKTALGLAGKYKSFSVLQNIYGSLYNVYSAKKNYKVANEHLLKSNAYKDSIFNIQKEKSLANIEAKYNSLKQEKENFVLTQQNAIKDAKIKRQLLLSFSLVAVLVLFVLLLYLVYRSRNKLSTQNKEIEEQADKLTKAYRRLKKLSDFKETMTNMLVHDLKTPLNVIVNYKNLKEMDAIDDMVQQSGYSMQNLVHNILDVYKYENTKLELNKRTISICELLNEAFEEVSFLAKEKELKFDYDASTEYIIPLDDVLIKRVFVNLFTNAVKYTPQKEFIKITCQARENNLLYFEISNPGPGIPKEKQELIFEYFKQAEQSDNHVGSSGIGLSFCKLAVEGHGGKIGVISEKPIGVTFWLTLPGIKEQKKLEKPFIF